MNKLSQKRQRINYTGRNMPKGVYELRKVGNITKYVYVGQGVKS